MPCFKMISYNEILNSKITRKFQQYAWQVQQLKSKISLTGSTTKNLKYPWQVQQQKINKNLKYPWQVQQQWRSFNVKVSGVWFMKWVQRFTIRSRKADSPQTPPTTLPPQQLIVMMSHTTTQQGLRVCCNVGSVKLCGILCEKMVETCSDLFKLVKTGLNWLMLVSSPKSGKLDDSASITLENNCTLF